MTRAAELDDVVMRYRYAPLEFAELAVPWGARGTSYEGIDGLWPWQRDFLVGVGREAYEKGYGADREGRIQRRPPILRAISSGTGTGKSKIVMPVLMLWRLACYPASRGVAVSPSATHLGDKLASNTRDLIDASPFLHRYFDYSKTDPMIWIKGCQDSRAIYFRTAATKEGLSGWHAPGGMGIWFDDAAGVSDDARAAVDGAMRDPQVVAVACGQPTRLDGWFMSVSHGDLADRWNAIITSMLDMPGVDDALREWAAQEHAGTDTEDYRVMVLGLPPEPDKRAFIPRPLLEEAADPDRRPLHDANGNPIVPHRTPLVAGLDLDRGPSLGASNAMAFTAGVDGRTIRPIEARGLTADERVAWAIQEAERPRPPYGRPCVVYYDATGLDGMWERDIARLGRERLFRPVDFSAKDPEGRYRTMRGAMWSGAHQWLARGGCLPADAALFRLVSAARTEPDHHGKLLITPKVDLGARAGRTKLDEWDARMLSMLAPPPSAIDHTLGGPPRTGAGQFAPERGRPWAG